MLSNIYSDEKNGLVPNTKWKRYALEQSWYLGETVINGIGQGYIQTTPLQLCLMTAQLANGGYKIKPHIIKDENINFINVINKIKLGQNYFPLHERNYLDDINISYYEKMYHKKSNINFILDAMFGSTNEKYGTSYRSRYDDLKYQFAGKTGTSQVRRITDLDRRLDLDTSQIEYKNRDHALYIAFAPYKDPRYAISVIIEHGGSGSKAAAPLASKLIKKIIDRHKLREQFNNGSTSLA